MKDWRKLHKGIVTSDKLALVSDAAFRLYTYLLAAQDDEGKYPWTATKRRVLTIGTGWDDSDSVSLGQELERCQLISFEGMWAVVVDGAEKQGKKRADVAPFLYEPPTDVDGALTPRIRPVPAREEERRGEGEKTGGGSAGGRVKFGDPVPTRTDHPAGTFVPTEENKLVASLASAVGRITTLTPGLGEIIARFADDHPLMPLDWPAMAADECERNNARKWSYMEGCLVNWHAQGFIGKPQGRKRNGTAGTNPQANRKGTTDHGWVPPGFEESA